MTGVYRGWALENRPESLPRGKTDGDRDVWVIWVRTRLAADGGGLAEAGKDVAAPTRVELRRVLINERSVDGTEPRPKSAVLIMASYV